MDHRRVVGVRQSGGECTAVAKGGLKGQYSRESDPKADGRHATRMEDFTGLLQLNRMVQMFGGVPVTEATALRGAKGGRAFITPARWRDAQKNLEQRYCAGWVSSAR